MADVPSDETIRHLEGRLLIEQDQPTRQALRALLCEAESRYGSRLEALAAAERHIDRCGREVERQRALVEKLHRNGQDIAVAAERILTNMVELQELYLSHHALLLDDLDKFSI